MGAEFVLIFKCQDNTYQKFSFAWGNPEMTDEAVRQLIQSIITNGSIFVYVPVKCVYAYISTYNGPKYFLDFCSPAF